MGIYEQERTKRTKALEFIDQNKYTYKGNHFCPFFFFYEFVINLIKRQRLLLMDANYNHPENRESTQRSDKTSNSSDAVNQQLYRRQLISHQNLHQNAFSQHIRPTIPISPEQQIQLSQTLPQSEYEKDFRAYLGLPTGTQTHFSSDNSRRNLPEPSSDNTNLLMNQPVSYDHSSQSYGVRTMGDNTPTTSYHVSEDFNVSRQFQQPNSEPVCLGKLHEDNQFTHFSDGWSEIVYDKSSKTLSSDAYGFQNLTVYDQNNHLPANGQFVLHDTQNQSFSVLNDNQEVFHFFITDLPFASDNTTISDNFNSLVSPYNAKDAIPPSNTLTSLTSDYLDTNTLGIPINSEPYNVSLEYLTLSTNTATDTDTPKELRSSDNNDNVIPQPPIGDTRQQEQKSVTRPRETRTTDYSTEEKKAIENSLKNHVRRLLPQEYHTVPIEIDNGAKFHVMDIEGKIYGTSHWRPLAEHLKNQFTQYDTETVIQQLSRGFNRKETYLNFKRGRINDTTEITWTPKTLLAFQKANHTGSVYITDSRQGFLKRQGITSIGAV